MIKIGDIVKVKIPVEGRKTPVEKKLPVVYIHPLRRWFAVSVPGVGGSYWTCYKMPSANHPDLYKEGKRGRR